MVEYCIEEVTELDLFRMADAGHVEKGKDPSIQTNDDVCRLAGALTRTSMPAPTQVTVNGKKLS